MCRLASCHAAVLCRRGAGLACYCAHRSLNFHLRWLRSYGAFPTQKIMPHVIIWNVPRAWHAFRTSRLQHRITHSAARSNTGSISLKCVETYPARRIRVRYSVFVLCDGTCMRVSCVSTFPLTVLPFPAALLCSRLTHIFSQFKLLIHGLTLTPDHAFTLRVHGINIPRA